MHEPAVILDYTNYKGVRRPRRVRVVRLYYGSTDYHPLPGYLLEAVDTESGQTRTFSMNHVHGWTDETPGPQSSVLDGED